jgi:hypothetical protein
MGCVLALLSLFVGDAFLLFGFKDETVKQVKKIIAAVLFALYLVKFSDFVANGGCAIRLIFAGAIKS